MANSPRTLPVRLARAAAAVVAVSVGLIGVVFNPGVTVGVGLAVATTIGMVVAVWTQRNDRPAPRRIGGWRALGAGVATAPVVAGLIVLVGPATVPIVALAAGAAIWWWTRRRAAPGPAADPEPRAPESADDLTGLSNTALAQAWRSSHGRLRHARSGSQLDRLCALRRRQLDEMERRDPDGFRRWSSSDEWVSGSAAPFLER